MVTRLSEQCRELVAYQDGVLARWQASGCAADLAAIEVLLRQDRWQTLYRGVYAAYTGKPSRESVLWAAVRRCGPEAALSHHSAAELDGLSDRCSGPIHVMIPGQARVRLSDREFDHGLPRIAVHRSARLSATRHPVRSPPRTRIEDTVLDLTELAESVDAAFSWLSAACGRRLVTPVQLRAAADRRAKLRWRSDILVALGEVSDGAHSALERGYLRNVERPHRLPAAERQARLQRDGRSAYLDNLYAEFGVAVELDGLASHPVEARWRDIHRDNYFARSGIITLRYSWVDIIRRPCWVAAEIALVLIQRGWTGRARACSAMCELGVS